MSPQHRGRAWQRPRLLGQAFIDGIATGSFDAVEVLPAPEVRFRTLTPGDTWKAATAPDARGVIMDTVAVRPPRFDDRAGGGAQPTRHGDQAGRAGRRLLARDRPRPRPADGARAPIVADRLPAGRRGWASEPQARQDLYYVVTLAWVGCVADTPEVARWFGDDIAYRRDSFGVDRAGLPMMAYSLRRVGVGEPARPPPPPWSHAGRDGRRGDRAGLHVALHLDGADGRAARARRRGRRPAASRCSPAGTARACPTGVGGEQIAPTVRLFHVADSVEVIHRTHGLDAAVDLARAWRGTQFAPDVVDAFCGAADDVLAGLDEVARLGYLDRRTSRGCRRG